MNRVTAALVLGAAVLIGIVVYGFVTDDDAASDDDYARATAPAEDEETKSTADAPEGDADSGTPSADKTAEPLVPRVLPPDAAIEDVRDAFAAKNERALRASYERVTRLTRTNATYKAALQRAVNAESDTQVAALVNSALRVKWDELDEATRAALLQLER